MNNNLNLDNFFNYIKKENESRKIKSDFNLNELDNSSINSYLNDTMNVLALLLGVDEIPFYFENINDDSRLYLNNPHIAINIKYKNNIIESIKSLVHEMRHYFQLCYAYYSNDSLAIKWKRELSSAYSSQNITSETLYLTQEIELDAFAYTKYFMKNFFDIDVIHPSKEYEELIIYYLNNNLIL